MYLLLTIAVASLLIFIVHYIITSKYQYWKKRGVPHPKPLPIVGNYADYIFLRKNLGQTVESICKQFEKEPLVGVFYGTSPAIIVKDPELIKTVFTKDFYYFNSREALGHTHREVFTKNVFSGEGDEWKVLRQNLTPLFSSAKMKNMFHLIEARTHDLEKVLQDKNQSTSVREIRNLMGTYTMDCIGSCIFGLETDVMSGKPDNPFQVISNQILNFSSLRAFKILSKGIWPGIFYGLRQKTMPDVVTNFFINLLINVFRERNYTPGSRQDFVDLVLSLKKNKYIVGDALKPSRSLDDTSKVSIEVTDEMLAAQCMIFFGAGFETSAGTMTNTLFELAKNEDAQNRLLEEIDEYMKKCDGKLTYDIIADLPFLDACVSETLRMYPVLGTLTRVVTEKYQMPSGLVLERGTNVHIPTFYIHKHKDYYPEPEVYNPERFYGENKKNIIPYTYFPFGEGPRICIGLRFAKMQMYAGLITILKKYRVELAENMPKSIILNPKAFVTMPRDGVYLNFIPRESTKA